MPKYRIVRKNSNTYNVECFCVDRWVVHFVGSTFARANAWLAKQYATLR